MKVEKFNPKDCVYFINMDPYYGEVEIEGWIIDILDDNDEDPTYKIKLRENPKQMVFKKHSELTQIFPDYWESFDDADHM